MGVLPFERGRKVCELPSRPRRAGSDRLEGRGINRLSKPTVKEAKQAEFLVHGSFPWDLVEAVGVISDGVRGQAEAAIAASTHRPAIIVRPKWYY